MLELGLTVTGTDGTGSGERGDACREEKKMGAGLSTPALGGQGRNQKGKWGRRWE